MDEGNEEAEDEEVELKVPPPGGGGGEGMIGLGKVIAGRFEEVVPGGADHVVQSH